MIITLISDLGINNPYHGVGEAIIYQHFPDAHIIYVSHQVTPFSILHSSYLWKCTIGHYPDTTYHISLVEVVRNFPAHVMHAQHEQNYYLGIDNGLLTTAFDHAIHESWVSKQVVSNFKEYLHQCCIDIQQIEQNGYSEQHFLKYTPAKIYQFPEVVINEQGLICLVIFIDKYENIITNLHRKDYEKYLVGKEFNIQLKGREVIHKISEKYTHSDAGGLCAYFNDFDYLQISMKARGAKTASNLGYFDFETESLVNTNISINFE